MQMHSHIVTSTGVYEVEREVVWAVLNFELVEENSEHLRCGHTAVDTDIGH